MTRSGRLSAIVALWLASASSSGCLAENRIKVVWLTASGQYRVVVSGLNAAELQKLTADHRDQRQWEALLTVFVQPKGGALSRTFPMAGTYTIHDRMIEFRPGYPLSPGVSYRAVFHPDHLGLSGPRPAIEAVVLVPARHAGPPAQVAHVYPSADKLPENLLKFYIHFSAPMSRGHIYDHIHLLDETGQAVELPFLEIDEELWDTTMTRLTLFIDPGRIKRGVKPLEDIGPALQAGRRYKLVIDSDWRDANGAPLGRPFSKSFGVGPPARRPLDTTRWQVMPPKLGTRTPLVVEFGRAVDHALGLRVIHVAAAYGTDVGGTPALTNSETRWSFTPAAPWVRGKYDVVVETTLEDLAGNNIGKPFEVDLFEGVDRRIEQETVKVRFSVR